MICRTTQSTIFTFTRLYSHMLKITNLKIWQLTLTNQTIHCQVHHQEKSE